MNKFLFDTDVLIEYLRGSEDAKVFLDGVKENVYISSITVAELYAGVRKGVEYEKLEIFIDTFEIVGLNKSIAKNGGLYRNKYRPSHGTGLADALIASTASEIKAELVTFNVKHFPMLKNVVKPYNRS